LDVFRLTPQAEQHELALIYQAKGLPKLPRVSA
jgi:hypothetical protein